MTIKCLWLLERQVQGKQHRSHSTLRKQVTQQGEELAVLNLVVLLPCPSPREYQRNLVVVLARRYDLFILELCYMKRGFSSLPDDKK